MLWENITKIFTKCNIIVFVIFILSFIGILLIFFSKDGYQSPSRNIDFTGDNPYVPPGTANSMCSCPDGLMQDPSNTECCICSTGFTGYNGNCEPCQECSYCGGEPTNCGVDCPSKDCGNGTCNNNENRCDCNSGYSGENCDSCAPGYTGYPTCVACETCPTGTCGGETTNCGMDCPSKDCGNGSCSNGVCVCNDGYSGANCEICTPDCDGKVCGNDSRCGVSCGTCGSNKYCNGGQCMCLNGFVGDNCEFCGAVGTTCGENETCVEGICTAINTNIIQITTNIPGAMGFHIFQNGGIGDITTWNGVKLDEEGNIYYDTGSLLKGEIIEFYRALQSLPGNDIMETTLTIKINMGDIEIDPNIGLGFIVMGSGNDKKSGDVTAAPGQKRIWYIEDGSNYSILDVDPYCNPPCPQGAICENCDPVRCQDFYKDLGSATDGGCVPCVLDDPYANYNPQGCGKLGCKLGYVSDGSGKCTDRCIIENKDCTATEENKLSGECLAGECLCIDGYQKENGVCVEKPNELPDCAIFPSKIVCASRSDQSAQIAPELLEKGRWQTPKRGSRDHRPGFQDMSNLVGYASIKYDQTLDLDTSKEMTADVDIIAIYKDKDATLKCYSSPTPFVGRGAPIVGESQFNEKNMTPIPDSVGGSKRAKATFSFGSKYTNAEKIYIKIISTVSENETYELILEPIKFYWQNPTVANTAYTQYFQNGQRGALVELFMWPYKDAEAEVPFLADKGYLGLKLFPVHEQVMSNQPEESGILNPWYFVYQPISYKFNGRGGSREELESLITTARRAGVRVYVDLVLNHFSGNGNDNNKHRNNQGSCSYWYPKVASGDVGRYNLYPDSPSGRNPGTLNEITESYDDRSSPYYTPAWTYIYNQNTKEAPVLEFPGAAIGPNNFHCERSLNSWTDNFIMQNGWLVGLTDLYSEQNEVIERQLAYMVDVLSLGISGFRIDAAKHMNPISVATLFKRLAVKTGGSLPTDFIAWLEILTGGEADLLWKRESEGWGKNFENLLRNDDKDGTPGLSEDDIKKVKIWADVYPKEPYHLEGNVDKRRWVIQQDDHDQQNPGSSSRHFGSESGAKVLVKGKDIAGHRNFTVNRLFRDYFNNYDAPIRNILSSYWPSPVTGNISAVPDGLSSIDACVYGCEGAGSNLQSVPRNVAKEGTDWIAHNPDQPNNYNTDITGGGYTQVHHDEAIFTAMQNWLSLDGKYNIGNNISRSSVRPSTRTNRTNRNNRNNRNNKYRVENFTIPQNRIKNLFGIY